MAEKKVFVFDIGRCSGCYNCQLACKDEHVGNEWPPYAKPQPDVGQFWIHVREHVRGTMPKVKVHYIPAMCQHCGDARCIQAAKDGAVYRRPDGLVIIDPEKAAGQRQLVDACPYGAVYWNEQLDLPQKCTGCAHLLDQGGIPRCVEACPTDAIRFGTEEELQDLISDAAVMQPEAAGNPCVYYRSIPGQFIGGTVYDPVSKEVIIGARCTLRGKDGACTVLTDSYGDFWHKDLSYGEYTLTIEADGFAAQTLPVSLSPDQGVNLGDIPMGPLMQ